jgi:hypothetical protein
MFITLIFCVFGCLNVAESAELQRLRKITCRITCKGVRASLSAESAELQRLRKITCRITCKKVSFFMPYDNIDYP